MSFNGTFLIVEERRRQIEVEGHAPADDMRYKKHELVLAAIAYTIGASLEVYPLDLDNPITSPPECWPWPAEAWKPRTRKDDLVRAGALIAAELDRLVELEKRAARAAELRAQAEALEA